MLCITQESSDPYFNLAIEEVFLKNSEKEYLILGINSSSVIIGKHQVAHREVNTRYITENKIPVIRRISGGGAVFHDRGNLNFTFIRQSEPGKQIDFRKYTRPVVEFLSSLGIDATFEGKSDLKINGLKISGNAEHVYRNRVIHHGTLLYNTSIDRLRNSLRHDKSCYVTRAVGSNPSEVTNLNDRITGFKDIYEFRAAMMNYLIDNLSDTKKYEMTIEEKEKAESLVDSRYRTWEWNWGYGPEYQLNRKFKYEGNQAECRLLVKDGIIAGCTITGIPEFENVSEKLTGCRHMPDDIFEIFKQEEIFIPYNDIFYFF